MPATWDGTSTEHCDAVVVGSGFGGSVAAYRLAQAGQRVVILERGRAYPPGSFPRTPAEYSRALWDPSQGLLGLFQLWSFRGLEGVVSSGLGGGSLIYANVLLRKDEKWFVLDDPPDGGPREWPVSRADLDPHYDEVERMMGTQPFPIGAPGYEASGKSTAMREAAARRGLDWQLPPLAVTFGVGDKPPEPALPIPDPPYGNLHGLPRVTCRLTGECDVGCNLGSKNTLDHTYLSAAAYHGADIRTYREVRSFEPTDEGWAVHYVTHRPEDEGQVIDTGSLPLQTITCRRLILGAGTFGSTYLLLRNRAALPRLSRTLGRRFCGNGDLLGFVFDAKDDDGLPRRLGSTTAPVITTAIRVPDELDGASGRGYYVEDAGYPGFVDWLLEASDLSGATRRAKAGAAALLAAKLLGRPQSEISAQISALLGPGSRSSAAMPLLGMGRDVPDGVMRLRGRWLDVDWTTRTSRAYFDRVRDTMNDLAREIGGTFEPNPLSWLDRVVTVHPLGGAPMGRSAADGVVDTYGEVFGNPGLFVVDGAVMPGPVGANPSLTIAAFADRAAQAILDGRTAPLRRRQAAPPAAGQAAVASARAGIAGAAGLAFAVHMKGFLAFDVEDPRAGVRQGRQDDARISARLQMRLDDVERFIGDPVHAGRVRGSVDCDALGGRLPVEGEVNLQAAAVEALPLRDEYRLFLEDGVGHPLTLVGTKPLRRDVQFGLSPETNELTFRILAGHVPAAAQEERARTVASGAMSMDLLDIARQFGSYRIGGADPARMVLAAARFGAFFAGGLVRAYRPAPPGDTKPTDVTGATS